ncbi:MAG: TlpA disulfide reductase family protein [Calditrichia bacterium]
MKRVMVLLLGILLVSGLLFAQEEKTIQKKAPDFVLKDLDGKTYKLCENLGQGPIVINFWATWCVPCVEEMKKLKKIYNEYSEKGVQFLAISVDDPKTVGRVKSFVKSHRYPFHVLLDTNNDVLRKLQGTVPPYTLVLDKDGTVVYSHVGYRVGDEKKLEEVIKELLEKSPPSESK